jgi:argininosuccinate synthase
MKTRIVAAYEDGPDAVARLRSLAESHDAEVVTVSVDLGHAYELDGVRQRALAAGAMRAHVIDLREEFARDQVLPALREGALDEGPDAMRRLAAPVVERTLTQIAAIEHARVAHDTAAALHLQPARRGRPLDRPADTPAHVEIEFVRGAAIAINGVSMRATELLESLATIAAGHNVGNADDLYGPAVTVLRHAYAEGDASRLTGTVTLKLFDGTCSVTRRLAMAEA